MGFFKRREYLNDIRRDAQGKLVYTGDHYRVTGDGAGSRGARLRMLLFALVPCALMILSGCIDAAGAINAFYVILPYIGGIIALFVLLWNLVNVVMEKEIRAYVYKGAVKRIPAAAFVLAIFAVISCAASAAYLIANGFGGKILGNILYPALQLLAAVISVLYGRYFRGVTWEKTEKDEA